MVINENDVLNIAIRIMDKLAELKILNKKQSADLDFTIQDTIVEEIQIVLNRKSLADQIDNNSISIGELNSLSAGADYAEFWKKEPASQFSIGFDTPFDTYQDEKEQLNPKTLKHYNKVENLTMSQLMELNHKGLMKDFVHYKLGKYYGVQDIFLFLIDNEKIRKALK